MPKMREHTGRDMAQALRIPLHGMMTASSDKIGSRRVRSFLQQNTTLNNKFCGFKNIN